MPETLPAPALAAITLAFSFGFALAGSFVRDRLPEPHLSKESQDVIRLGMGLVATMTALLLGMVTATTRIAYDAQDTAIKTGAVNILTLDRHMARYGETTRPTRELLRKAVEYRLAMTWPDEGPARGFTRSRRNWVTGPIPWFPRSCLTSAGGSRNDPSTSGWPW